jgi:CRP/FNR family cyclic AMP-dependent transcriptional regulator
MGAHSHFLWTDLFRRDNAAQRNLTNILKDNVLFRTLTLRELKYLANLVYERVYQPNEPIFQQNDRGLGMYLIAKGRVAIKSPTPDGEVLVTTLTEGSFFGEIALVDPDNLRSASAVAAERCIIIGFFKPDLMEILERKPEMGVKILFQLSTVLGKRLLETTERIALTNRGPLHGALHGSSHGGGLGRRGERFEKGA